MRIFRRADFGTDHYLVVAEVREILAGSKGATQKFNGERFNLKKLNVLKASKQYQIEIKNRFEALENLSDDEVINRISDNVKENIKTSGKESLVLHELKQQNHSLMKNI